MIGSGPTQVVLGHFPQSPFFRSKSGFAVDLGCDLPSVPECTSPCKLFKPSGLFPSDVNRPHIGKRERLAASYHVGDRSYTGDHPTLRHARLVKPNVAGSLGLTVALLCGDARQQKD